MKAYCSEELALNGRHGHRMLNTEETARQRLCAGPEGCGIPDTVKTFLGGGNQWKDVVVRRCAGSECMAWRWEHTDLHREATDEQAHQTMNTTALSLKGHVEYSEKKGGSGYRTLRIPGKGYCGYVPIKPELGK